ncbi:MAG: endonuclease/exonuclease/phosphatase family protein [Muribaculum sp.]|nr:endonuclease/exonuclease/phosphatase family protein [Muribaculum sp.]
MKYSSIAFLLATGATLLSGKAPSATAATNDNPSFNVMSFNIRFDSPEDSLNNWQYRKDRAANAIKFYDADILGTQEVLKNQLDDLNERLPQYTSIGVGREDGKEEGEYSALFYKTDRFDNLESGTFWLSETPDSAGSLGWDAACVRVATWARLKDKASQRTLFVLNTHLDHVGATARHESIKLILSKIDQLSDGAPVIVTGDFNSSPEEDVIKQITDSATPGHLTHSHDIAKLVYGPAWSLHFFGEIPYEDRPLIDYVFVRGDIDVERYGVLAETDSYSYLSDHAPILTTITLK